MVTCPSLLLPMAHTAPVAVATRVWCWPHPTATTPSGFSTCRLDSALFNFFFLTILGTPY